MAAFHVFISGAVDGSAAGVERLAQAIASYYGLPADDLRARIANGRFRVKGNCDRATAERFANDLSRLGATCTIEEATPANHSKTPLPFPAVSPPLASTKPPPTRPVAPSLSGKAASSASAPVPGSNYQSGLSAAFAGSASEAHLGALESEAFTLASLDGTDDVSTGPAASLAPPPPNPVEIAPPAAPSQVEMAIDSTQQSLGSAAPGKAGAIDMFAPPDEAEHSLSVDLAPEEVERAARKRASAPPPEIPVASPPSNEYGRSSIAQASVEAARYSRPSLVAPNATPAARSSHPLANPMLRFVLGVIVALAVGFLPAHIIAAVREKSVFSTVNANVRSVQDKADTAEAYAALDVFRTEQLARKYDERRSIAMMALLIWAAAGGAIAYVWFRRIPWPEPE
jgi:hypothetical protein